MESGHFVRWFRAAKRLLSRLALARTVALAVAMIIAVPQAAADTFPPVWGAVNEASGPVHFAPVAWPSEPDPALCGASCGDWKPYTRFQAPINDPRTQDPSNGGTAPQNYVNIASSCIDKTAPSIYYYLYKDADPTKDVLMFRWRVEQIANNYATGPSPGNFGATDPWSSGLWTVLFDVDGSGYRSLAAHLNGSSGDPSHPIDLLAGIWGNIPTQSIDYLNDPSIHLIAHNPTAFTSGNTILNFQNSLTPTTSWPAGSSASGTSYDYGTTRARVASNNSCTEYFVDYQIPIRMLDASATGPTSPDLNGPKITRSTPLAMLFCTANSLNNPFQKDCALNRSWLAHANKPAPFGDYISFDQAAPYAQPIVASVTATAPSSCLVPYALQTKVQDTQYVNSSGAVVPSIKEVKFYYWLDKNGDGAATAADTGSAWTFAATGTLKAGTNNTWTASWDSTALPKGQYLIGVQAVDDRTLHDDGVADSPVDNRTFSYLTGSTATSNAAELAVQGKIYTNAWSFNETTKTWTQGANIGWIGVSPIAGSPDQQVTFTAQPHADPMTPGTTEDWFGNPAVTGVQTALVGLAVNACGVAPTITKAVSPSSVAVSGTVTYTVTIANTTGSAITLSQIDDPLPSGFAYASTTSVTNNAVTVTPTSPTPGAVGTVSWTFGSPISVANNTSLVLIFTATAGSTAGTYNNTATASTSFGSITSAPVAVGVDAARISLSKTPSTYLASPSGTVTYTLAYSNDSSVAVTAATISDVLPAGVTYSSCSGGTSCGNSSGTVTWNLGTLAGGASGTVTLVVTVGAGYNTTSLTNSATLDVVAPNGVTHVTKTASSTIAVDVPAPAFTLTKTASATQVAPSGSITWTITYKNYGLGTASGVTINDALPPGFTWSACSNSCTHSGQTVSWNIGTVAASGTASVTVTATAGPSPFTYTNPATNNATIIWTGNGTGVSASNEVGVTGQACSAIYYFHSGNTAGTTQPASTGTLSTISTTGNTLVFTSDVAGSAVVLAGKNLSVSFYIDPGSGGQTLTTLVERVGGSTTTITSYSATVPNAAGWYTFSFAISGSMADLAVGERLRWTFTPTWSGNKTIKFYYDGNVLSNTVFGDSRSSICTATSPAALTLSKTVDQANIATASGTLNYVLSYANVGGTSATGVSLVDTLPSNLTCSRYTSTCSDWSSVPGSCSAWTSCSGGSLTLSPGSGTLTAGTSGKYLVQATVGGSASGTLTNSATLSGTGLTSATATAATSVGAIPSSGTPALSVSKSASSTSLSAGNTVTYTLRVVNTGTGSASSVVVSDNFPYPLSYFAYGSCTTATGSCNQASGILTWTVGTLAAGASASLTFTMNVASTGVPAGVTTLDNLATVADGAYCTSPAVSGCTSGTVTVSISGNPNLTVSKTSLPASVAPGGTVTYTLLVTNTGSAAASSVVVTDPVPANMVYSAITSGTGSFDAVNNRVVFNIASLAAGASTTLAFTATVAPLSSGDTPLHNTATASAANAPTRSASADSTGTAAPIMTLQKTGPSSVPYPAATLTATAATGATTLFVNGTAAFSVGQYVKVGTDIRQITAMTGGTLTVSPAIVPASTLPIGTAVIGSATYALAYQNSGNADAASVVASDPLPSGWVFVAASPTATSVPAVGSNGTVSWSIGTVAAGSGGTLQLTAIPTAVGSSTNTATLSDSVYCAGGTPPVTCSSSVPTTAGGLTVTKTTSTPNAAAGGAANWTITVSNSLDTSVAGVKVTDILPSGFAYSSTGTISINGTSSPATLSPASEATQPQWGTWTLPGHGTLTIPFIASVGASVGPATYQNAVTLVTTTATAGITNFDPLSTTDEDVTVLASGTGIANGIVYRDINTNGVYDDAVDIALAGVAVTIIDSTSTAYVVYTDASGFFSRVVAAGSTIIDVDNSTLPAGLVLTTGTDGVDPSTVTVPEGGAASRNTGYVEASGTIGNVAGNVWNDVDVNGAKNGGEANMLGVQVILRNAGTNAIVATAYTDVSGNYSFPNVATGSYKVDIVPPSGYFVTTANDPFSVTVAIGATETVNFGLALGNTLSGTVFKDNGAGGGGLANGLQGGTEPGTNAGGLNVVIVDGSNKVVGIASVSGSGAWSTVVLSGQPYQAYVTTASPVLGATAAPSVVLPSLWSVTKENLSNVVQGVTGDGILTGIDVSTGNVSGINFGLNSTATTYIVSGLVFNDADGSGLKNGSEAGTNAGGLYAVLVDGSGNVVASSAVAAGGTWSFADISTGTYTVRLSTTAGSVGNPAPAIGLPVGWFNTGESVNGTSTDGSVDGSLSVTVSGDLTTPTLGIRQHADVIVQKNGPGVASASGTLTYTVHVYNAGPGSANGTVLTDNVPSGVTNMTWTCGAAVGGAACPASSGSGAINQTIASLPAGGRVTYTISATAPASGSFTNTATATVPSAIVDPDTSNNSSSVTTLIGTALASADLVVRKYGPASVSASGAVSYLIVVSNAGPGAANNAVFADDAVTAGLTSVSWTCGNAIGGALCPNALGSGAISETIATFPAGSSLSYSVSGTAPASGTVTNTATVAAPAGVTDPDTSNNTSSVSTLVTATAGSADLAIAKTGPAAVAASSAMTYKLIVSNAGPDAVSAARVVDAVPSVLTGVTWTCGAGTGGGTCVTDSGSGNAIDTDVNLPVGATVTITVSSTAPASAATFINIPRVIPPIGTGDPTSGNNISGPVITTVNPAPAATNDSGTTPVNTVLDSSSTGAGQSVNNANILTNDSGIGITLTSVTGTGSACGSFPCTITTSHGQAVVQSSGTYVYTPTTGYSGSDSFTYMITDSASQTATATVNLTVTPKAVDDGPYTVSYNTTSTGGGASILSNDAGSSLVVSSITGTTTCSSFPCTVATTHGSVTVQTDGTFSYTPTSGYSGADSFTYIAKDSSSQSTNSATVSFTVQAAGAPPLASNDSGTTPVSTALNSSSTGAGQSVNNANILTNDSGIGITLTSVTGTGAACSSFPCTVSTSHGSVVVQSSGTYVYTPTSGYSGSDSFTYVITDSASHTGSATVNLTVTPKAADDGPYTVPYNTTSTGGGVSILNNDAGSSLVVKSITGTTTCSSFPCTVATTHGSVTVQTNGTFSYTPTSGYHGADSFTYIAKDSSDQSTSSATVSFTVQASGEPPLASNDSVTTNYGVPVTIAVLSNDAGGSSSGAPTTLVPNTVDLDPSHAGIDTTYTIAGEGTFTANSDGTVTFTPVAGFYGTSSIPYTVADSASQTSNTALITVVVAPPNPGTPVPPVANGDFATKTVGVAVILPALANDVGGLSSGGSTTALVPATVDLDTSTSSIQSSITTAQGTWTVNTSTGEVTFTPVAGFSGTATLPYTVQDSLTQTSNQATLTVVVSGGSTPVASPDTAVTKLNTAVSLAGLDNDKPSAGYQLDPATVIFTSGSATNGGKDLTTAEGTWHVNTNGSVTFTPGATYTGTTAAVPYSVTDTNALTATSTITVTVTPTTVNAADDTATTAYNTPKTITVAANDSANAGATLDATTVIFTASGATNAGKDLTTSEGGWHVNADGSVTFTPNSTYIGTTAAVTYRISDSLGHTATANMTVTVTSSDMSISLAGLPTSATVGVAYSGSFTCSNGGTADASAATTCTITSGLPTGVSVGSCTISPANGVWVAGNVVAVSQTVTCTVSGTPTTVGSTVNGSTGASNDSNATNNSASVSITIAAAPVAPTPVLTIAKSHSGSFTQGQSGATYTIAVGNSGTAATSGTITVSDTLPTGLTYVSGSGTGWSCSASGQALTCTSGTSITAGGSGNAITLTVNIASNAAASITNTAGASGGGASNTPTSSNPATINAGLSSLTVDKTVYQGRTAGSACPGVKELVIVEHAHTPKDITWCFAVTNTGNTYLANPLFNDPGLSIASGGSQAAVKLRSGVLPLAPGASATWYVEDTRTASLLNTVTITMTPSDAGGASLGQPTVNATSVGITTFAYVFDPPFGIKTGQLNGLSRIRWTMVWINDNVVTASNVLITDPPPVGMTYAGNLVCTPQGSTVVTSCGFEAPSGSYPRGRVVVRADIGPDLGATNQSNANNALQIAFDATIDNLNLAQTFQNQGTATWNPPGGPTLTGTTSAPGTSGDPTAVPFVPQAQGIPTLSEWGLIVLSGLVAMIALLRLRRRGAG